MPTPRTPTYKIDVGIREFIHIPDFLPGGRMKHRRIGRKRIEIESASSHICTAPMHLFFSPNNALWVQGIEKVRERVNGNEIV